MQRLARHMTRHATLGAISLAFLLVACGGQSKTESPSGEIDDSVEAVRTEASATQSMSLDDWDIEECKENLLKRYWDQEQRDEACEQIDEAVAELQRLIDTYADDHLVGIAGALYTDQCMAGFGVLYAEEDGEWVEKESVEYPASGNCDGTAWQGIGAAGILEYAPPVVEGQMPTVNYGYAAIAARAGSGAVVRVKLASGDTATLVVKL
jgi:hypothetical protein